MTSGRVHAARADREVATWALVSAATAPIAMIGGWTVAAAMQDRFDGVGETISALAASTASAPWVMGAGLAVTGLCHVVTASGLRPFPTAGRLLLALGGVATAGVAALPVDLQPAAHGAAAAIAFGALSAWPAGAWRSSGQGVLSARTARVATSSLVGLLVVFVLELQGMTPLRGAATGALERLLAGTQAVWPLVVVLALRRSERHGGGRRSGPGS
ncbi:DUF998 domain-containing protein [Actinotalea sp. K2]|uniref:DUF998 domain-containing protein n=1 Tax=Actinotalea sp. K2 TaxID=2939438 RepID=UPI002017C9A7|nr:DUF998 domain-containing protein [Actinotalea sp. K2]MCL3862249.1 DUF998 domain-containing protein [Actinotalea sp. K2]